MNEYGKRLEQAGENYEVHLFQKRVQGRVRLTMLKLHGVWEKVENVLFWLPRKLAAAFTNTSILQAELDRFPIKVEITEVK